jgi:predicted dehydrogenase
MRFALLGDHPDGVAAARALVDSGRHQLVASTAALPASAAPLGGRRVSDLEAILADPAVEAVIVASGLDLRAEQLRRALQSERHALCVHPVDRTPDGAYEAGMIRDDVGCVLLPLLAMGLHPAVRRLAEFIRRDKGRGGDAGEFMLLEMEIDLETALGEDAEAAGRKSWLPGWDALRALGGEAAETSAFAVAEELTPDQPALLAGRFLQGGLFRIAWLPGRPCPRWRFNVVGARGEVELLFPDGVQGPAYLSWRDASGEQREEAWEPFDPWPALVERFETALASPVKVDRLSLHRDAPADAIQREKPAVRSAAIAAAPAATATRTASGGAPDLSWQDEVRCLELDDAARRSVQKRRSSVLDYQVASEEVGFKGTMTLVGCGMLWICLLLLVVSRWAPAVGWIIFPVLFVFLGLQLLRYLIPSKSER